MKGYVNLKYHKSGILLFEESHNLIVDMGGIITANRLVGNGNSSEISQIIIGDNNVDTTDKTTTSLAGNTFTKAIDSISASGQVTTINFSFSTAEFNGYDIWQFGLLTDENQLFSILSRMKLTTPPTISKDVNMDIEGIWTITAEI